MAMDSPPRQPRNLKQFTDAKQHIKIKKLHAMQDKVHPRDSFLLFPELETLLDSDTAVPRRTYQYVLASRNGHNNMSRALLDG